MKLGEALIRARLITRAQLSQALERQVILGGRLGTSLIELGYITEVDLVTCLSNLGRVPYAPFSVFWHLPPEVIQLIPKELALKYQVVPLKKERNQIHLAMADPANLETIDELRFILGCVIIPYVASELRVQMALEKYYGVPREQRYVSLTTMLEEKASLEAPPVPPSVSLVTPETAPLEGEARVEALSPLETVSRELVKITHREDLGHILLRFAQLKLRRAALFIIKGDKAFGWMGAGKELLVDFIPQIEIDLKLPSLLSEAVSRKSFYVGALLPVPQNQNLLQQLGRERPQEVLAFPLLVKGKTVMVLYGDDGDQSLLLGDYEDLKKLALKASMALEILILRNKILEMG